MDKPKNKQMLYVLGALVILFLFLWFSSGKTASQLVNKVANSIGLPNVAGFDINAEGATYNIPGLKVRKGCGQSACSFNIIPQTKNSMGLASPSAANMRAMGGEQTMQQYVRGTESAIAYLSPPFYPFASDRMVGG